VTALAAATLDQTMAPDDLTAAGADWESLAEYGVAGNSLVIELSNAADGVVIADAIRIEKTRELPAALQIADDGDAGFSTVGTWTSAAGGYLADKSYVMAGTGSKTARWTFTVEPGIFRVSATWQAASNRVTDAQFEVLWGDDGGPLISLHTRDVDQTQAPNDLSDSGAVWEDLGGNHTITGDTLVVELTDDATGPGVVIADAIRAERVAGLPQPVQIVDDGDPAHALTGSWNTAAAGYLADMRWVGAGSGSKLSTWTFTVEPGDYDVAAAWVAAGNRATDSPFTILNGATPLGTVDMNQQSAPDDFTDAGATWETIGTYTITGTTLVVQLSDDADGLVIADAIRIEAVTPLLAAGLPATATDVAPLTTTDLSGIVSAAIDYWQAAGLTPGQLAVLESAEYRVDELTGLRLGQAGSHSITIDADAAGYGWFIDVTPSMSEEFAVLEGSALVARRESAAEGRMDLLTAVLHEMGHLLGLSHSADAGTPDELMDAALLAGRRHLPGSHAAAVDAVFEFV
jgi:hypothetical protein